MPKKLDPNQETPTSTSPTDEEEKLASPRGPERDTETAPDVSTSTATHPSIKNN